VSPPSYHSQWHVKSYSGMHRVPQRKQRWPPWPLPPASWRAGPPVKAPAPRDKGPAFGLLHTAETKPSKTKPNPSCCSQREHAGRQARECGKCKIGQDSQQHWRKDSRAPLASDPREMHCPPLVPESWFSFPAPCLVSSFLAPILTLSGGCHFDPTEPPGFLCLCHIWLWAPSFLGPGDQRIPILLASAIIH